MAKLRGPSRSSSVLPSDQSLRLSEEDSSPEALHFEKPQQTESALQAMCPHPPLFQMGNQQSKDNASAPPPPFNVTASALTITSSTTNIFNQTTMAPTEVSPSGNPTLKLRPTPSAPTTTASGPVAKDGTAELNVDTADIPMAPIPDQAAEEDSVADTSTTPPITVPNAAAAADNSSVKSETGISPPTVSVPTTSTNGSTANALNATSATRASNTSPTPHGAHRAPSTHPTPTVVDLGLTTASISTPVASPAPSGAREQLFGVQSRAAVVHQARSRPPSEIVHLECAVEDAGDDDSLFGDGAPLITDSKGKGADGVAAVEVGAESNGKRPMQDDEAGGKGKKKKLFHSLSTEDTQCLRSSPDGHSVPLLGADSAPTDFLITGERNGAPAVSTAANGHTPASTMPKSRLANHDDEGYGSFSGSTAVGAPPATVAVAPDTTWARFGFMLDEDDDPVPEDDDGLFRAVVWKRPTAGSEAAAAVVNGGSRTTSASASTSCISAVRSAVGPADDAGQGSDGTRYPKGVKDRIETTRPHQAEKEKEKEKAAIAEQQKKQAAERSRRMREETEERKRSSSSAVSGGLTAAFLESDDTETTTHGTASCTSGRSRVAHEERRLLGLAKAEAKKTPTLAISKLLDPAEKEARRAQRDDVPTNAAVRAKQDVEEIKRRRALPMAVQRGLVPARGVGLLDEIANRRPMDVRDMLAPAGEETPSRHFHPGMRKNVLGARDAEADSIRNPRKESLFEKMARESATRATAEKAGDQVAKEASQAPSSNGESTIPSALRDKMANLTEKLSDKDAAVVRDHELAKERVSDLEWLERAVRETARLSCMIDAEDMNRADVEKVLDFADLVLDRKGLGYTPRLRVKAIKDKMARRIRALNGPEPDDDCVEAAIVLLVGQGRFEEIQTQYEEAKKEAAMLQLRRQQRTGQRRNKKRDEEGRSSKTKTKEPKPPAEFHTGMAIAGKLGGYKYRGPQEEELAMSLMRQQLAKLNAAKEMPVPTPLREQEEANNVFEDSESEESVEESGADIYAGFGGPVLESPVVPPPVKAAAQDVAKESPKAVQMPSPRSMSREEQDSEQSSPEDDVDMEEAHFDEPRHLQVAACRYIVRAEFWNMAGSDFDVFEVGRFNNLDLASAQKEKTVGKFKCRCWISPEMITGDTYERSSFPESCYLVGWEKKEAKRQSVMEHGILDRLISDREQANADAAQLLLQWYLHFIDIDSGEYKLTSDRIAEMYQKEEADGLFEYSGSVVLNNGTEEEMHVQVKELRTRQTGHSSSQ